MWGEWRKSYLNTTVWTEWIADLMDRITYVTFTSSKSTALLIIAEVSNSLLEGCVSVGFHCSLVLI